MLTLSFDYLWNGHRIVKQIHKLDVGALFSFPFYLPSDIPVSTPAIPAPNDIGEDDDDEPPLNENDDDDDDELDDVDQGEDLNTQHLVLAQFDKVWMSIATFAPEGIICH